MEHSNRGKFSGRGPRQIVIEINVPILLAMFALLFVAGWIDGYRRRGDFQVLEAQNAHIIHLLEGAEITRARTVEPQSNSTRNTL